METKRNILRKLSADFTKDVYRDSAKKYVLPGKILLQGLCCWPDNESKFKKLVAWFLFWNLFVIEIFHTAYVFKNFNNISEAVGAGATVSTTLSALVRLYALLTKKGFFNAILVKVWKQFWPVNIMVAIKRRYALRKVQIPIVLALIVLFSSIIGNIPLTGAPFLVEHGLVLKSVFPFDWRKIYVYELIYVWQYYCDWFTLLMINAFDFFFIALVSICSVQFAIMQEVFSSILDEDSAQQRVIIFGRKLTDREMLFECLEQHKLLISICNELEDSFNIVMLLQFCISTVAICAAILVLKVDHSQFLKMFMYGVGHLFQLFYYCFAGDQLTHESGRLSNAIYECNWHLKYNQKFRKALLLMIQRSQRVQSLTAAGVIDLDLVSFLKIMKLSFSIYTLLDSLLMKNIDA